MTVGFDHVWAVKNIDIVLSSEAEKHGCHVSLQQPVAVFPDSAPEPDGAITRGTLDNYRNRYPAAADVPCIIEVADSSLQHDRLTKKRIYARAGFPQYILINLVDRVVEVCELPNTAQETYDREFVLRLGEVVRFSAGEDRSIEVEVARLFPTL